MITPDKISIPLLMVISMLGVAAVAGGAWAGSTHGISAVETRETKTEERADKLETRANQHDVEHEGMRHDLQHLVEAVDRIERNLGTSK